MSHRQRRVAALSILVVIVALFLNGMLKKPPADPTAAQTTGPVGQPAAVYVPRHAQVVAQVPPSATAAEVAAGFATAYFTYDSTVQSLDQHLGTLPHPAPGLVSGLTQSLAADWATKVSARAVSKLIGVPSVSLVSSDPTGVLMDVTATASVTSGTGSGYSPAANSKLRVKLVQQDSQWLVVSATEGGQGQ